MRVDVIIPTYNHSSFVKEAVLSVITQTHVNTNVIVVDDGSTDNTSVVIKKLMKKHLNIHYIRQINQGLSSARNTGLTLVKSRYVAFLDADDSWESDKLAKQLAVFKKSDNKSLGLVYCDFNNLTADGIKQAYPTFKLKREIRGKVYNRLLEGNYVAGSGSSVVIKTECFKKCGNFDETLESCEDWDMWLRISKEYAVDYVDEKLVNIRLSPKSMSNSQQRMCMGMVKLYEKHSDMFLNTHSMRYLHGVIFPVIVSELPSTNTLKLIRSKISRSAYNNMFGVSLVSMRVLFTSCINRIIVTGMGIFK